MDIQLFLKQSIGTSNLPGHQELQERISTNLAGLRNVVLVAHRGWGKTLLLKNTGFHLTEKYKDIRVFYFDMEAIYDLKTFIKKFIQDLFKTFSTKVPVNVNLEDPDLSMWSLTESLAARTKTRLILFILNFQQFNRFENSRQVLRGLYHCWKSKKRCVYCISGNNRHFFNLHFSGPGKPFPHFAKIYYLKSNFYRDYLPYINSLFHFGGKRIDRDAAVYITNVTDSHLHYLQVLCWQAYMRTEHRCTILIAEKAFNCMVLEYKSFTDQILEQLTKKQFNYLRALMKGTQKICSEESLEKYNLSTSGHVSRIKQNLENKGILEVNREFTVIIDPMLKYRLVQYL